MTTIRVRHVGEYVVIANSTACDSSLSFEARGLLLYLLSKPDSWHVRLSDLKKQGNAGERKVNRILAELKLNGYMTRTRVKTPDGRFDWDTIVFETPELARRSIPTKRRHGTIPTSATDGSPRHGSPRHGSATDGARRHIVRTDSPSIEEQSTEARKTEAAAAASPSLRSSNWDDFAEMQKREPTLAENAGLLLIEKDFGSEELGKFIHVAALRHPEGLTHPLAYLRRGMEGQRRDGGPGAAAPKLKTTEEVIRDVASQVVLRQRRQVAKVRKFMGEPA